MDHRRKLNARELILLNCSPLDSKEIRQTWRRKAREDKAETGVMLTQAKGRLGPPELKESRKDFPRRLWRE